MGSVFTLLFAPTFLLFLHYLEFQTVALIYIVLSVIHFFYIYFINKILKDLILPSIYIVFLTWAYFYTALETIKLIPVIVSALFFILFMDAYMNHKKLVLSFTRRLYPKALSDAEVSYLSKGDGYWVLITLINTLVQMSFMFYDNNIVWAIYSSIGWYVYFFTALIIQYLYGKLIIFNEK